jgi:hypothetical protein
MSKRVTRRHPDECPACYGFGQNEKCATLMKEHNEASLTEPVHIVLKTVQLGSGCLRCGGTGRLTK